MQRNPCSMVAGIAVAVAAIVVCLASCGLIGSTDIGDITANPRKYAGTEVTVTGEVTEVFALVVLRYFVVRDKTGEITVVTERPLPQKGEKLTVKGTVREAFSLGSRTLLVIAESAKK